MIEVYWAEGGREVLRAKFRTLADALRYVWRYGRASDARLRLEDGRWLDACEYEVPRGAGVTGPILGSHPAGVDDDVVPTPISLDLADITDEVVRRTQIRDVSLVRRIVSETMQVLADRPNKPPRSRP